MGAAQREPHHAPADKHPAYTRQPGQSLLFLHPIVGHTYTPGLGLLCEVRAICPSHVIVKWLYGSEPRVILLREDFERRFEPCSPDAMQQPDMFR